jgi:lycopene cyclase domain-containing protein
LERYLYILVDLGAIIIPLVASFHDRLQFTRQWRFLFPALLLTMLVFIPWDIAKTHIRVWGFSERYTLGMKLFNLPLEEWLFFIAIPYSCLFTYHALSVMVKKDLPASISRWIAFILGIGFLLIGFCNLDRMYTSVTFISTGSFLLFHYYLVRSDYLGRFFIMYLVTLLPFFLVDGILTGSFIPGEVVFYNNAENLGIRLGTIPIEDMVYGMLLLLMNVSWYELFRMKSGRST